MKSTEYVLLTNILTDVSIMCNTSMDRDLKTIRSRIKAEGLSFLTITLPAFAKGFERCLEQGCIDPSLFPSFAKKRKKESKGLIPAFLSGIVSMVFDPRDGVLRKPTSVEAIDGVRQICLAFNKLTKECTNARKRKAIDAFKVCEEDLASIRLHTWSHYSDYCRVARMCFGRVFSDVQENLFAGNLVPKHGPGAVIERLRGNAKYSNRTWTYRLERAMSADNHIFSNSDAWLTGRESLVYLKKEEEEPVKVIFVPKTAKTPRVIAIEPVYMQYTQQALMSAFVEGIEADPILGKSIHFTDSSVNSSLARKASKDKSLATLDLSEASDRVHASLVSALFGLRVLEGINPFSPWNGLRLAVFACRSAKAKLPTGEVIRLKKFASMGSALCFPAESMVFFTLCVLAGLRVRGKPVSLPHVRDVASRITVFGDDLIVPVAWSGMCMDIIESVGLRVNRSKSFSNGSFRESCGMDAYEGHEVTPVYVRSTLPVTRRDTEGLLSTVATSNLFYKKGYWKTANYMRLYIENLYGFLPHVSDKSSVIGWRSFMNYYSVERWNKTLSRFEVHGLTVKSRTRKDFIEGYDRLLRFHLEKARQQRCYRMSRRGKMYDRAAEDKHLAYLQMLSNTEVEESTLRGSAYTKRRWTTSY
jgi:hypothetical protein